VEGKVERVRIEPSTPPRDPGIYQALRLGFCSFEKKTDLRSDDTTQGSPSRSSPDSWDGRSSGRPPRPSGRHACREHPRLDAARERLDLAEAARHQGRGTRSQLGGTSHVSEEAPHAFQEEPSHRRSRAASPRRRVRVHEHRSSPTARPSLEDPHRLSAKHGTTWREPRRQSSTQPAATAHDHGSRAFCGQRPTSCRRLAKSRSPWSCAAVAIDPMPDDQLSELNAASKDSADGSISQSARTTFSASGAPISRSMPASSHSTEIGPS